MTTLERPYAEYGQSPWLDNLTRGYLRDGTQARMVADGIRGVTANPTIVAKAIVGSADYDEQFTALTAAGCPLEDGYRQLVVDDTTAESVLAVQAMIAEGRSINITLIFSLARLAAVGIDMHDVRVTLENQGVAGFHDSYQQVLAALAAKTGHLSRR
jgi:transaldolase